MNRSIGWTAAMLAALMLVGCSKKTPEEQNVAYSKAAGSQAELTATHLIVKWPERRGGSDNEEVIAGPTTLKIPRGYLHGSPGRKDKEGGIEQLTIVLGIPDGRALKHMDIPLRNAPQAELDAYDAYEKARVMVWIERNGGYLTYSPGESIPGTSSMLSDGVYAGLQRYSPYQCISHHPNNSPEDPAYIKWIKDKPADDLSPENCRLNRLEAFYMTAPSNNIDPNFVRMRCSWTHCNVRFNAAERSATLWLKPQNLEHWRDYVEPARKLINSFVVKDAAPASAAAMVKPSSNSK
jgi:hypothetical protein